jgi:hypothetical protein
MENFEANKTEWKLVMQKAIVYLKKTLKITEKDVNDKVSRVSYKLLE